MYTFGHWLRDQMQTRRIRGIPRLAREAGLDPARVGDWVLDRGQPNAAEAVRLARYLGIPVDRLHLFAGDFPDPVRRLA